MSPALGEKAAHLVVESGLCLWLVRSWWLWERVRDGAHAVLVYLRRH